MAKKKPVKPILSVNKKQIVLSDSELMKLKFDRLVTGVRDTQHAWHSLWTTLNEFASGKHMIDRYGGVDPTAMLGHAYQGMAAIYGDLNKALEHAGEQPLTKVTHEQTKH